MDACQRRPAGCRTLRRSRRRSSELRLSSPDIVLPAMDYFIYHVELKSANPYGFKATYNATHPDRSDNPFGWVSPWQFGLHQGPITLMVENYRSGLLWRLMRSCPYIVGGLRRAGFTGGWL